MRSCKAKRSSSDLFFSGIRLFPQRIAALHAREATQQGELRMGNASWHRRTSRLARWRKRTAKDFAEIYSNFKALSAAHSSATRKGSNAASGIKNGKCELVSQRQRA